MGGGGSPKSRLGKEIDRIYQLPNAGGEGVNKVARWQNLIPSFPLDCARVEGVEAKSKEGKGSNFAA